MRTNKIERMGSKMLVLVGVFAAVTWAFCSPVFGQWTDNGANLTTTDNVGIGTTNPSVQLHIKGAGGIRTEPTGDAEIAIKSQATNNPYVRMGIINTAGTPYGRIWTGDGVAWRNLVLQPSGGNVGIGTTAPGTPLEIKGADLQIRLKDSSNTLGADERYDIRNWESNLKFDFRDDDGGAEVTRMFIHRGGNVGIGTISPGAKLHVVGASVFASEQDLYNPAVTSSQTNYLLGLETVNRNVNISAGKTDSGYRVGHRLEMYQDQASFAGTLNAQIGLWSRVGIWANAGGTINNVYGVLIDNFSNSGSVINNYGLYQSSGSAKNYFGGKVGIGTTGPANMLDVNGNIGFGNGARAMGLNGTALYFDRGGSYFTGYGLLVGAGSGMVIDSNGNVGIGKMNPVTKLEVNGTISAREVNVTAQGWSDFVLKDDYDLMPLNALEERIKEERRLPGIPSEQEVQEQGINIGQMQAKLLEKIEELTLHVIALHKENEQMKKENEGLHKNNEDLHNRLAALEGR